MYVLVDEKGRHYLVKGESDIHTNYGVVKADALCEENIGKEIESHMGRKFALIRPAMTDFIAKAKKGPQSIALKDCGIVCAYTGIRSGSRVLDSGTGSGVMSMFLANIVYPQTLYSYEIRDDFAEIAKGNFEKANVSNIEVKMKSVYDGIDEEDLDLVHLDVPEPWLAIEHARKALKPGGYLVSYSPSIEQSKKFCDRLDGFEAETIECIVRNWDMKVVRPYSRMLGHTGFMTFARLMLK